MEQQSAMLIVEAHRPPLVDQARELFAEYAESIVDIAGCSLQHQGFSRELAELPGKYAPPRGCMLVAQDASGQCVGCIAMRPLPELGDDVCEMKRLYVRPSARGSGAGRLLCEALLGRARGAGYRVMKLDTAPQLASAIRLYERLGFTACAAYNDDPDPHTVWMERRV